MKALRRGDHAAAWERRQQYYELRREGLRVVDAAAGVGVTDRGTRERYERWFQAIERGEEIVPAPRGGQR